MSDELQVWENGRHVGAFRQDGKGVVSLEYDDDAIPISMSLMPGRKWEKEAPGFFLENLLPDSPSARDVMADSLGAKSTSAFDLLDGVDATGGLVFTRSQDNPFDAKPVYTPMSQRDVIDRVRELRRYGSAWWANDPGNRFSLGGNQGKFSAARIGGRWFYPNAAVPSTHIFKPNPRDLSDAGDVEAATMRLSRLCGIPTPRNQSMLLSDRLGQERCYIIERFDRKAEHGRMIRLRCEDMLQAMGRGSEDKYETTASDCLELLDRAGPDGELAYQWLERLAFNAYSGNSDAHAKNYSLMLGGRIALAPAYDEVCTRYWPRFDQEMAMPIAGERYAENVEPKHWERFARSNGFDSERVAYIAETMRNSIREHMDEATKGMDPRIADRLRQTWTKTSQGGEKAAALPDLDAIEAKRR